MTEETKSDLDVKQNGVTPSEAPDEITEASSTSTTGSPEDVKANQSMGDFITKSLKADATDSSPEGETEPEEEEADEAEASDESSSENEPDEKEGEESNGEKEDSEGEEAAKADDAVVEGKPVPYERFKEINEKATSFKTQLDQVQPEVDAYRKTASFCQSRGITPEQYNKALEVQALLNTDPAKALEALLPIVEALQGFTGNKLPADLQKEVDDGVITLARAQQIAKLQAQTQFGERKSSFDKEQMQKQQEALIQRQFVDSAQAWVAEKRKNDPDYKPKAKDSDLDGKFELAQVYYLAMVNKADAQGRKLNPVNSPQDMVALLEKSYELAGKAVKPKVAAKATRKPLLSNGSSTVSTKQNIEDQPTMAEGVRLGLAQRGRF